MCQACAKSTGLSAAAKRSMLLSKGNSLLLPSPITPMATASVSKPDPHPQERNGTWLRLSPPRQGCGSRAGTAWCADHLHPNCPEFLTTSQLGAGAGLAQQGTSRMCTSCPCPFPVQHQSISFSLHVRVKCSSSRTEIDTEEHSSPRALGHATCRQLGAVG